jgi:hypothetical protein
MTMCSGPGDEVEPLDGVGEVEPLNEVGEAGPLDGVGDGEGVLPPSADVGDTPTASVRTVAAAVAAARSRALTRYPHG